jgi:hypothetical protein
MTSSVGQLTRDACDLVLSFKREIQSRRTMNECGVENWCLDVPLIEQHANFSASKNQRRPPTIQKQNLTIHARRQLGGRRPRPLVGVSRRHDGSPAGSDCYSAAIAVAATSPAITLASRNVPIATSSILSQSVSTLPLCCPNSGAGPTAGGASPKRTGQPLIV